MLPKVSTLIQDPGLGITAPSAGRVQVKLGVSQKAVPNVLLSAGTTNVARDAVGHCPMLEAAALVLDTGGAPIYFMPVAITDDGTVTGTFTLQGSGTGTVTGARAPQAAVRVKIILGGTPGTMTYQTALGANGTYGPTITSTADPYSARVAGQQFTKLGFGNVTYVAGDIYTIGVDGVITRTGSGPATALDTSVSSPVDAFDIRVQIMTGGGLGAGGFRYSLDGGESWSGEIGIPSAPGRFVIPDSGVMLTFAGTFTLGDTYTGTSTPPGFSTGELTNALLALRQNPAEWGFFHIVGTPANAAAALSLAAVASTQLTAAEAEDRFVYGVTEAPHGGADTDTVLQTTFAGFVDPRVGVGAAPVLVTSPITGRRTWRNVAWAYTAKRSAQKLSTHPGQTAANDGGGPLRNVTKIVDTAIGRGRDETATPLLDAARFITARSIRGQTGYFITRGRMMAAPGSDFGSVMNRAVMDRACTVSFAAFSQFLNKDLRIDPATKYLDERDAQEIEAVVQAALEATLVHEQECSAVQVTVSRTDNLLSTSTLNAEIGIVPKGYSEFINNRIGFVNPLLQRQAA